MRRRPTQGAGFVAGLVLAIVAGLFVYAELAGAQPQGGIGTPLYVEADCPDGERRSPVTGECLPKRCPDDLPDPAPADPCDPGPDPAPRATVAGYGGTGGTTSNLVQYEGDLPFTGLDVGAVIFGGFVVLVVGLLMLRPVKTKGDDE